MKLMKPEIVELSLAFEDVLRWAGVSLYGPVSEHNLGYWRESLRKPEKVLRGDYGGAYDECEESGRVHEVSVLEGGGGGEALFC